MKIRLISFTCWLGALLISAGLSVLTAWLHCFSFFVLFSMIWVVMDSKRVQFWHYESGISGHPSTVFIFLLLLGWPIVFPWYLGFRLKVLAGTARLREEYKPWQMSDAKVAPNGLVQPWRGRKL